MIKLLQALWNLETYILKFQPVHNIPRLSVIFHLFLIFIPLNILEFLTKGMLSGIPSILINMWNYMYFLVVISSAVASNYGISYIKVSIILLLLTLLGDLMGIPFVIVGLIGFGFAITSYKTD